MILSPAAWLQAAEKHPTRIRCGGATWWRWKAELGDVDIDTLPTPVFGRLPASDSPSDGLYPQRRLAIKAAKKAVETAMIHGWIPERICEPD